MYKLCTWVDHGLKLRCILLISIVFCILLYSVCFWHRQVWRRDDAQRSSLGSAEAYGHAGHLAVRGFLKKFAMKSPQRAMTLVDIVESPRTRRTRTRRTSKDFFRFRTTPVPLPALSCKVTEVTASHFGTSGKNSLLALEASRRCTVRATSCLGLPRSAHPLDWRADLPMDWKI